MSVELEMDILKLKIWEGLSNCQNNLKKLQYLLHKDTFSSYYKCEVMPKPNKNILNNI